MLSVVVRGFVLDDSSRVLLVSHAPSRFWYTPGGHLDDDEGLAECLERELREETGIAATHGGIVLIDQVIEHEKHEHKLEIYFVARTSASLPAEWRDEGGPVQHAGFFAPDELALLPQVFPVTLTPAYLRALGDGSVAGIPYRDVRPS
jgi:ADP-ribose pyrophosphatase YjhB (NUDIX family)